MHCSIYNIILGFNGTHLINLLSWSIINGIDVQLLINLLNDRPIPEIIRPLRSLNYCELSATNIAISVRHGIN